jgi:1,4-alpha-glucan branching enzyme
MSIKELRKEIISLVNSIEDKNLLESYLDMMKIDTEQVSWDDLTPEEQNEIMQTKKNAEDERRRVHLTNNFKI